MASLREDTGKEALVIEELEPRDEEEIRRGKPAEVLEDVPVGLSRTVKIGSATPKELKEALRNFLWTNLDVFA